MINDFLSSAYERVWTCSPVRTNHNQDSIKKGCNTRGHTVENSATWRPSLCAGKSVVGSPGEKWGLGKCWPLPLDGERREEWRMFVEKYHFSIIPTLF